ncbi:MAG: hypothetical protein AAGF13_06435 [Pseudomonadota bacterium]
MKKFLLLSLLVGLSACAEAPDDTGETQGTPREVTVLQLACRGGDVDACVAVDELSGLFVTDRGEAWNQLNGSLRNRLRTANPPVEPPVGRSCLPDGFGGTRCTVFGTTLFD